MIDQQHYGIIRIDHGLDNFAHGASFLVEVASHTMVAGRIGITIELRDALSRVEADWQERTKMFGSISQDTV
jgi:hypothetical protein